MAAGGASSDAARAGTGLFRLQGDAHDLVHRLPDLVLEAVRISNTIAYGLHGRRRAGPGETFWQFRLYETGDAVQSIDWRRSASTDQLFVREREWEAAHTVWLWADLSPSMQFKSHLASISKRDRALVLLLATSELLVHAGERVAYLGLTVPSASRSATRRITEQLAANAAQPHLMQGLPPRGRVSRFSGMVLISDFLDPVGGTIARIEELAGAGVTGHLIQILDPAEETLPYDGRTEFLDVESSDSWTTDRAEGLRTEYIRRLTEHRARLSEACRRAGWSFLTHRTDRPATEPLLQLVMQLQSGGQGYRWGGQAAEGRTP